MTQLDLIKNYSVSNMDSILEVQKGKSDLLCNVEKKQMGIFLTEDPTIIESITSEVINDPDILEKVILEPSCGNGIFLAKILIGLNERGLTAKKVAKFISEKLIFCDIKQEMILQTQNVLSNLYFDLYNEPYSGKFNSYCLDFTKEITSDESSSPLKSLLGKIDYIVGNPPFVTLYGRRDQKESEAQREYFLRHFKQFPRSLQNGKLNISMMFLENSVNLLKSSGHLSFVLDISFFEMAFEHTRKFLVETTTIEQLQIGLKAFAAGSGQIILKIRNVTAKLSHEVKVKNLQNNEEICVKQSTWNSPDNEYKFLFHFDRKLPLLMKKIESSGAKALNEVYPTKNLRTCCMLLDMEPQFTSPSELASKKNKEITFPYFEGSKSLPSKFAEMNFKKVFYYDKKLQNDINDDLKIKLEALGVKNKKRIGLGEIVIYENPKLFVRQSAKELIASRVLERGAANNSLYVFSTRDNSDDSILFIKFLEGYFNSRVASFYSQAKGIVRYQPGKQPQIKTSDLYGIPVPVSKDLYKKVADISDKIHDGIMAVSDGVEVIDGYLFDYFNFSKVERKDIISFYESYLTK